MKKILMIISFFSALSLKAQEIQVPMDVEGKVNYIDYKLEKKLELFSEYKGFKEARLFQIPDSSFVMEILYQQQDKQVKKREPLSKVQVEELRKKITDRIRQQAPEIIINQEGRTKLLVNTTLVSLAYYGWVIPKVLGVNDNKGQVGLYMLTSGAGFFLPFFITKNSSVTDAEATMSDYGQTRGIIHGMLLSKIINDNADINTFLGFGMAASIAEGFAGYAWAQNSKMSAGTASTIGVTGDFGLGIGAGLAHVSGLLNDYSDGKLFTSMLLGTAAGIATGSVISKNNIYTKGDAYVLRSAGLLGAYVSLTTFIIAEPNDPKFYSGGATLGALGGLLLGHYMAKENDFTTGQGVLISLSEIAGGLIGLGTGYLISGNPEESNGKLIFGSSALGAIAGFALMSSFYSIRNKKAEEKKTSFNFNINPQVLFGYLPGNRSYNMQIPVFSASLRF
ncbi:MAG: hypothetical protein Q8880_07870 [Bacteroidota bacterium]|nr:hypothetical protein [Bacteroidota bacterium]